MFTGPNISTDGLVLSLDAANSRSYPGSGTTWTDLSGNGNNGTLTNGPTFNSANGGNIVFDGVDDYINCGNQASLQITGNLTLESWIKESSAGSTAGNFCSKNGNEGYRMRREGPNGSPFWIYSNGNTVSGGSLLDNVWYMVTGVFSSTGLRAYINGILVASNTTPYAPASVIGGNFQIGAYINITELYGGAIASMKVYNKALSASEIAQNYNSQKSRFNL